MTTYEQDPDVIEWGLQFFAGDMFYNIGYCDNISRVDMPGDHRLYYGTGDYDTECSDLENDQLIAHALQQELSQLAVNEELVSNNEGEENLGVSLFSQDWFGQLLNTYGSGYDQEEEDNIGLSSSCSSPDENLYVGIDSS